MKINDFESIQVVKENQKKHIKYTDRLIELTDRNGNITYVDDNMVLAKALNVCIEAINRVLSKKCKYVRGCRLRFVDKNTLKEIENNSQKMNSIWSK